MGFLDDASELFDRGVSVAKGAVSNVALEQLGFMRAFCALCREGAASGYHEANGGNASYVLTDEDVRTAQSFFFDYPSSWVPINPGIPSMAASHLLVTASGAYLKNVPAAPSELTGIIQLSEEGDAWRVVWGFKGNRRPTSELLAHLQCQGVRRRVTEGKSRVLYHAHPVSICALTAIEPADSLVLTNLLWRCMTESVIAFPEGLGALPWMVPGSKPLADSTAEAFQSYKACLWALHGVFASGETCDDAFGLVQAIDKAAEVYLRTRSLGLDESSLSRLSDGDLRSIAAAYNLPLNEAFL